MKSLPLVDTCKIWHPALYKNLNYPSCNDLSITEDWNHIFDCLKLQNLWISIELTSIAVIIEAMVKVIKGTSDEQDYYTDEKANQLVMDI